MFTPDEPLWQLVARAAIVYIVLMVLVRLSGKRTVGEFTAFDLVVVMLIAEAAQGALTGADESVSGGLVLAATLIAINYGVGYLSTRSRRFDSLVEGDPVVLIRNGRRDEKALLKNNIPASDLEESLRKAGFTSDQDVRLDILETDGEITVIPMKQAPG